MRGDSFFPVAQSKAHKRELCHQLTKQIQEAFALTAMVRYPEWKKGQEENIKHPELSHISLFPNAIFALNAISYITLYDT